MGLRITTDGKPVTVYRQDKTANSGTTYQQYSLGVASKDKDGNWVNGFIDCQFKKGVDVANKAKINITNGFYIVSEYNGKSITRFSLWNLRWPKQERQKHLLTTIWILCRLMMKICHLIKCNSEV